MIWICRLCRHNRYKEIDKAYICEGCSTMFADPAEFSIEPQVDFTKVHLPCAECDDNKKLPYGKWHQCLTCHETYCPDHIKKHLEGCVGSKNA